MKKDILGNFAKFSGKHLVREIFKNTVFTEHPWTTASGFFIKWDTANNVWKNSDEYSLPRNTNFGSTVQVYFFLGSINFQCMFSLVYTVYCQKQPSE